MAFSSSSTSLDRPPAPVQVPSRSVLGGTGSILGKVTLEAGGRISPGNSIESLDAGSPFLSPGSVLDFEFGPPGLPGTNSDSINVADGLFLLGGSFALTDTGGLGPRTYTLIDYAVFLEGGVSRMDVSPRCQGSTTR